MLDIIHYACLSCTCPSTRSPSARLSRYGFSVPCRYQLLWRDATEQGEHDQVDRDEGSVAHNRRGQKPHEPARRRQPGEPVTKFVADSRLDFTHWPGFTRVNRFRCLSFPGMNELLAACHLRMWSCDACTFGARLHRVWNSVRVWHREHSRRLPSRVAAVVLVVHCAAERLGL